MRIDYGLVSANISSRILRSDILGHGADRVGECVAILVELNRCHQSRHYKVKACA